MVDRIDRVAGTMVAGSIMVGALMRTWILALAAIASSAPAVAAPAIQMPIARGLWVAVTDKCATATNGYVFDGTRWGAIYFYGPKASMGPGGRTGIHHADADRRRRFHLYAVRRL